VRVMRPLIPILVMAAALQAVAIARNPIPAQDGLKFIRVAREFGHEPWADVVRDSDQHPLYSALIALVQPGVARVVGSGPEAWRIAAQGVSAFSAVLLLVPLYALTRRLADERTALLSAGVFALLPIPAELGHETLSDAPALFAFTTALAFGASALRTGRARDAATCGLCGGIGFLIRPEAVLLPAIAAGLLTLRGLARMGPSRRAFLGSAGALAIPLALLIGGYATVKGTLSEKLAIRQATGIEASLSPSRSAPPLLPKGLDDPRWDFSPKEESDQPERLGFASAVGLTARSLAEAMAWIFPPIAALGAWVRSASAQRRGLTTDPSAASASQTRRWPDRLILVYVFIFLFILVRHAMNLGYVSSRHTVTIACALMPWTAIGLRWLKQCVDERLGGSLERRRLRWGVVAGLGLFCGFLLQMKPGHPSRWGHQAAGRWLLEHAHPADAILDTRGWAAFFSGARAYDPWHIPQALSDASLAYVVIGEDELRATSRRAETLRALLDYTGTPVAAFPERRGSNRVGVWIYRFRRPASWEGLTP